MNNRASPLARTASCNASMVPVPLAPARISTKAVPPAASKPSPDGAGESYSRTAPSALTATWCDAVTLPSSATSRAVPPNASEAIAPADP